MTEPVGRFGTILGMVEPSLAEDVVTIDDGDTLVMFTDGLTDAPGDQAVPFDELDDLLSRSADDVETLADEIRVPSSGDGDPRERRRHRHPHRALRHVTDTGELHRGDAEARRERGSTGRHVMSHV